MSMTQSIMQGDYTSCSKSHEVNGWKGQTDCLVKSLPYPVIRLPTKVFFTKQKESPWEIFLSESGAITCAVTRHRSQGGRNEHHDSCRVRRDGCRFRAPMFGMRTHRQGSSDILRWFRHLFSGLYRSQGGHYPGRNQWSLLAPVDSHSSLGTETTENASALFAVNSPSQPIFGQTGRIPAVKPAQRSRDTISQSSKKESSPVKRTVPRLTLDSFAGWIYPAPLDGKNSVLNPQSINGGNQRLLIHTAPTKYLAGLRPSRGGHTWTYHIKW